MLDVTTPIAVLLLVCIGVGGCGCHISWSKLRMGTASRALIYNAPSSASAAEDTAVLISCAMLSMAPLLAGSVVLDDMKK